MKSLLQWLGLASWHEVCGLTKRVEAIEKRMIVDSGFWDPLWYVRTYGYDMTRSQALDHWYREGWRKGENPSPRFDVTVYAELAAEGENPLLAYLNPWKFPPLQPCRGNPCRRADDDRRVAEYWARRAERKPRGVIYTCITGGYDDLRDIAVYGHVSPAWDYVCFTDDKDLVGEGRVGIWEVRPLAFSELDLGRNNRWHKTHPHVLFPEMTESVYIDANIDILSPALFDDIDRIGGDFVLPRHFGNQCIYAEFRDVVRAKIDDVSTVERQLKTVQDSGMPRNYGHAENNVLYRRHGAPDIVALDEEWWNMIRDRSRRDQLSLMWLFWKRGWRVEDMTFENTRLRPHDFFVFGHRKGGKGK